MLTQTDAPRDFFDCTIACGYRLYILLPLDFLDRPCFNRLPLHIYILPKVAKYVLKMTLTQGESIL